MEDNSTSGSGSTVISIDDEIETRKRHSILYWAAFKGDWHTAERILNDHKNDITAKLSKEGDTVLHIAAAAGRTFFVAKLVRKMEKEDLAINNNAGNTAFFLAAASKNVAIVKVMMKKNKDLIKKKGYNDMLPLVMASMTGNKKMIEYLYEATAEELLDDFNRIELLVSLINHGLYVIALDLVERHPKLAIARDKNQLTALHHLAKMPVLRPRLDINMIRVGVRLLIRLGMKLTILLCNLVTRVINSALRRKCVQDINKLGFRDRIHERRRRLRDRVALVGEVLFIGKRTPASAFELIRSLRKQVLLLNDSEISEIIRKPWPLMFEAAKQGNVVLLDLIWETYPDMMFEEDENHYSIFHVAVMYRQHIIFGLIHKIDPLKKDLIVRRKDTQGNNMLHLAAKLSEQDRSITISPVAAHRMGLELMWFKAVKKILRPVDAEAPNYDGKTARALFTEEHKELREKAEKWTKENANAGIVVATLISTVAFAAALTVPGGTKEQTGTPHFVKRASFIIFAISDTLALLYSSFTIVSLIAVFAYPFEEKDFDRSGLLHTSAVLLSLNGGLDSLFYSVGFMMVAFCANMFIVFKDGMPWIPVLVTAMTAFGSFAIRNKVSIAWQVCVGFTKEGTSSRIARSLLNN